MKRFSMASATLVAGAREHGGQVIDVPFKDATVDAVLNEHSKLYT